LDDARNGRLHIHRGIIDFILGAVDLLRKKGLMVDDLIGKQEVVIKNLG